MALTRRAVFAAVTASGLAFGLSACNGPDGSETDVVDDASLPTGSPTGAIAPAGLEQIKWGMPQRDVLRILGARYQVIHAAAAGPDVGPLQDAFQYIDSGRAKWVQIEYTEDGRVSSMVYGYEELFGIE